MLDGLLAKGRAAWSFELGPHGCSASMADLAEIGGLVGARHAHAWLPLYALLRSAVVQLLHEVELGIS
ncbi:hypothetical protein Dimus_012938 [Dionaea muscipula]